MSGENLVLTENASFFNYFQTTTTQVLDTDPIDIAASGTQVNTLKNSVGFNESLLLFSDTAQYKLDSAGDIAYKQIKRSIFLNMMIQYNLYQQVSLHTLHKLEITTLL